MLYPSWKRRLVRFPFRYCRLFERHLSLYRWWVQWRLIHRIKVYVQSFQYWVEYHLTPQCVRADNLTAGRVFYLTRWSKWVQYLKIFCLTHFGRGGKHHPSQYGAEVYNQIGLVECYSWGQYHPVLYCSNRQGIRPAGRGFYLILRKDYNQQKWVHAGAGVYCRTNLGKQVYNHLALSTQMIYHQLTHCYNVVVYLNHQMRCIQLREDH